MSAMKKLYTLKEAVETFLPGFTVSSLRTAIRHGHLVPLRFAGKFCVTESAIQEMLDKCREKPKAPGSGSDPQEPTDLPSGSSSTEERNAAQAAARATLRAQKERSRPTSRTPTSRQRPAAGSPRPTLLT